MPFDKNQRFGSRGERQPGNRGAAPKPSRARRGGPMPRRAGGAEEEPALTRREHAEMVAEICSRVVIEGLKASTAIEAAFRKAKLSDERARGHVADSCYQVLRKLRLLLAALEFPDEPPTDPVAWHDLAVLEAALASGYEGKIRFARRTLDAWQLRQRMEHVNESPEFRLSLPDWLQELGNADRGAEWIPLIEAQMPTPPTFLRGNPLKTTTAKLRAALNEEGLRVETVPEQPEALRLHPGDKGLIFRCSAFKEGLVEVQDLHAQLVAPFLQPEPGQRVIDLCAGEGGKALHLAALMKNKGRLLALDIVPAKLERLRTRAARAGIDNLEARPIEGTTTLKRLKGTADRVLVDAPCSGLGVLRRHPEIKWHLTRAGLAELQETQAQLLRQGASLVKAGGQLVFVTCSVLHGEGEIPVRDFIAASQGEWTLDAERRIDPVPQGGDGFYLARLLRRKG